MNKFEKSNYFNDDNITNTRDCFNNNDNIKININTNNHNNNNNNEDVGRRNRKQFLSNHILF